MELAPNRFIIRGQCNLSGGELSSRRIAERYLRYESVGCVESAVPPRFGGRKAFDLEIRIAFSECSYQKLTADIGARYLSLTGGDVLAHAASEG